MKSNEVKELARKQIDIMKKIFSSSKANTSKKAYRELYELANTYLSDSEYFFKKGDYVRAFESVVISWAYFDSLLHLGKLKIDKKYMKYFTVEETV